jgi:addiction module HigA family antidote
MLLYPAIRDPNRAPTHPGALIEDILVDLPQSKAEIARMLGISRQHLYDILNERKPVTAATAVRLGKLFGDGPDIWLHMQAAHDAWHAEREVDVSNIPTLLPA